jgi:ribosome-binding protein aMBF1 (putative translation factor)
MAEKKIQRVTRTRRLTPQEVTKDKEIRRRVEKEFPPARRPLLPAAPNSLSEALRKAIRSSGKSVYQLAKAADVSQIVVSRFLSGQRDIRMETADRLAGVLGLKVTAGDACR